MLFHHFKPMFPHFNGGKDVILMGSSTIIKVEVRQLNFQFNINEEIFPHLRSVFIYIVSHGFSNHITGWVSPIEFLVLT